MYNVEILMQAQSQQESLSAIRRHLHQNPEIGFELPGQVGV